MAVALEFLDFIVPIETIRRKYPGSWERCLEDHAPLIGHRVWYDEHLFRDGAMSPRGIGALVDEWSSLGFDCMQIDGERRSWKDVCVVESMLGGPTLPCLWICFSDDMQAAYLRGTAPGAVAGRRTPKNPKG